MIDEKILKRRAAQKKWREKNSEKLREIQKRWRENNREKARANSKKWRKQKSHFHIYNTF